MAFGDADASTPAFVSVNANWTTTGGTSTAFTPPAGSLVVLFVFSDTSAGANPGNETVTDSAAGATGWVFKIRRAKPDSGSQAGCVAWWEKVYVSAPGAPIMVTVVGNATGANAGGFKPYVVASCSGSEGHAEGSNTAAAVSLAITSTTNNARGMVAATDWNVQANMTAGTGQTAVLSSSVGAGPDTRVYVGIQNAVTTPAGTATMSTASPTSGNANNFIGGFLVPAAGGSGATVTPPAVAGVGTIPAPTVSAASTVTPAAVAGVGTVPAPTVAGGATIVPAAVTGVGTLPAPAVSTGVTLTPAAVAGVGTVPAPTVSAGSRAVPAAVQGVGTVPAPTLSAGSRVTPAAVAGVGTVPAPTLAAGATVTATAVAGVGTLPAPSVSAGGNAAVNATTVQGVGTIPAPTLSAGSRVVPAAVAGVGSIPAPALSAGATVTATTVAGVGTVPAPTLAAGSRVTPTAVAGVGTIPAPTVTVSVSVTVSTVAGVGTVPAPTVTVSTNATVVAFPVTGVGSIPAPTVSAGGSSPTPILTHVKDLTPFALVTPVPLSHVLAAPLVHVGT